MKLAFCLFNYFPYGGLQRDFLRIARLCLQRGHEIHVFTMRWDAAPEPDFHLHILKASGWQNHVKAASFAKKAKIAIDEGQFDLTIGFNKMPHLDIYYAADVCYVARIEDARGKLYNLMPRFRQWAALEKSVFAATLNTQILLLSAKQEQQYIQHYQTEPERFHLLPPGIDKNRLRQDNALDIRNNIRTKHQMNDTQIILLMVGSGFKTKGVDRSIRALAALPDQLKSRTVLWVIGKDDAKPYVQLAQTLHIANKVCFLGARDDVPDYLLAADLLLQPSYHENTGTVILEALAAGLPVATVATCGYAFYVREAQAGQVLDEPFTQLLWNQQLFTMLTKDMLKQYAANGFAFAKNADIYSLPEKAADFIESRGGQHATLHHR